MPTTVIPRERSADTVIPRERSADNVIPHERSECWDPSSQHRGQFTKRRVDPSIRSLRSRLRDDDDRSSLRVRLRDDISGRSRLRDDVSGGPRRSRLRDDRFGFTLFEMAIVLAIMALSAALVVPALARLGQDKQPEAAAGMLALLHDARKTAIDRNVMLSLRIDPLTGRYRADTTGVAGTGEMTEGSLPLDATETLVTEQTRLTFIYRPTGGVFADSVLVRGLGATVLVSVDPWSGIARADAR